MCLTYMYVINQNLKFSIWDNSEHNYNLNAIIFNCGNSLQTEHSRCVNIVFGSWSFFSFMNNCSSCWTYKIVWHVWQRCSKNTVVFSTDGNATLILVWTHSIGTRKWWMCKVSEVYLLLFCRIIYANLSLDQSVLVNLGLSLEKVKWHFSYFVWASTSARLSIWCYRSLYASRGLNVQLRWLSVRLRNMLCNWAS